MKIKSTTLRTLGLLAILLSVGLLRAQNAAPTSFPAGDDRGKQEWIKANPDAYRKLGGQVNEAAPTKLQNSTQPDALSEQQKLAIIASRSAQAAPVAPAASVAAAPVNQLPWGAPENKAAWIAAHPAEYGAMNGHAVNAYPWGDESNKAAWIAAHPAEFAQMNRINGTAASPTVGATNDASSHQ